MFRWLTVVILLTAGLFLWESTHRESKVERRAFQLNVDTVGGLNLADTMAELYPDRGDTRRRKAIQAGECFNRILSAREDPRRKLPDVCRQYDAETIVGLTRSHFEKGIATGAKNDEQLHYLYIWFLMRMEAGEAEIERARRQWRRLFPLSRLEDPVAVRGERD